jgi:hypothetical protein
MKFVLLFGPQAVGKMTVGQQLERITDLKLFHNHMTIDLVNPFFDYGTEKGKKLVGEFRRRIFEEVADSDLSGLIFTYVWAFDQQADWDYVEEVCAIFESKGADIYFAELEADSDVRLLRNKSEHRLSQKPTKRVLDWSENDLLSSMEIYRLNSDEGEIKRANYTRINNTNLPPEETARQIKNTFNL